MASLPNRDGERSVLVGWRCDGNQDLPQAKWRYLSHLVPTLKRAGFDVMKADAAGDPRIRVIGRPRARIPRVRDLIVRG